MIQNKYKNDRESKRNDLESFIRILSEFGEKINIYAIGGTAMVLAGHKPATKDIDFLTTKSYKEMRGALEKIGLKEMSSNKLCNKWIFSERRLDIFYSDSGQIMGFPLHSKWEANSKLIKEIGFVKIYILNWIDIISTKLARGEPRDIEDIISIIKNEKINFEKFEKHFLENSEISAGSFDKHKNNLKELKIQLKEN